MKSYKDYCDEQIIEEVRSTDRNVYRQIVDRYQEKIIRYVKYIIKDEQKASDVVQETFIKAFVNLNSFDIKKKFSSWLYRIAHNEAMNAIKKYHRELPLDTSLDVPSSEDIEIEFTKKEIISRVQICLDQIPLIYSEPLALYYLEDKSYDEICDILKLPIGTVGTRINRAKSQMKIICQKQI